MEKFGRIKDTVMGLERSMGVWKFQFHSKGSIGVCVNYVYGGGNEFFYKGCYPDNVIFLPEQKDFSFGIGDADVLALSYDDSDYYWLEFLSSMYAYYGGAFYYRSEHGSLDKDYDPTKAPLYLNKLDLFFAWNNFVFLQCKNFYHQGCLQL